MKIPREQEPGASILLWLADHVISGEAYVAVCDWKTNAYADRNSGEVRESRSAYLQIEIGVSDVLAKIMRDRVIQHRDDVAAGLGFREGSAMSLGMRFTHAERMALKWSAAFEQLHRTIQGGTVAATNPYEAKRGELIRLVRSTNFSAYATDEIRAVRKLVLELFDER